jgi:hypothetical protein
MPDGDRLYWKVRGKGSRRVLNLLQSGLDDKLVADSAIRMFVERVNHGGWKPVLREIAGVLVEALRESPSNGTGVERTDRFFQLTHQVEAAVSNHGDRALAPMIRAAQHVFQSLEDSGTVPNGNPGRRRTLSIKR